MPIRGIRGAVPVTANTKAAIAAATRRLLRTLIVRNRVAPADIAGAILTATPDLDADFPATAARGLGLGWSRVPLLCAQEIAVPGAMPRLVRALLLVNTDRPQKDIRHAYLGAAAKLRPDLAGSSPQRRRER
jgi:chorismate mutase